MNNVVCCNYNKNMKMRILFFNYEYPPLGGGAGNATLFLLQEYSKFSDLRVDLITSSLDDKYHLEKINKRIKIHRLPIGKKGNQKELHYQTKKDLIFYSWKAFWFSRKLIKKNNYDLSHAFFTVPCGALSWYFKLAYKLPYLISLRGSDVPGYSERFDKLYKFLMPLIKSIWKRADKVIANSQGLAELAKKSYPQKKIAVIANGVDTKKFNPQKFLNNNSADKFSLVCGTRITPRKGFIYLINALEKLQKKGEKVYLEIIGEGDQKELLEKMVREKNLNKQVKFLGVVDHEEIPSILSRADVFVSPSLNEGMANAMLEALAMGLPLIATDIGGTKELIKDGENGLIVKTKNVIDLADKIAWLKNNPAERKRMGIMGRQRAEKMSWDKIADKYKMVYDKIVTAL